MITKMMNLASIAALLLTAILWSYAPGFDLPLRFSVGLSALLVGTLSLLLALAAPAPCAASLIALKTQPLRPIPSIAGRPGGESL